jgi:hypothetical protein
MLAPVCSTMRSGSAALLSVLVEAVVYVVGPPYTRAVSR